MRSIVSVALLAPALLFAVSMSPVTVLPNETPVRTGPPTGTPAKASPGRGSTCTLGIVDTIGGTTYDWQASGPELKLLSNTLGAGVHAVWMYSTSTSGTTFPDRNMRYNFYDYATRSWNWPDPDFMLSGVNTFSERTGFGNVDADPNTGVAVISAHHTTVSLAPILARDIAPGGGIFEYCPGEPNIDDNAWAWVGVGTDGYYQLAMIDYTSKQNLLWSRAQTWCNWEPEVSVPPPAPEPLFPDHGIAASKVPGMNDVCITWVNWTTGYGVKPGYYRLSTDGGDNWGASTELSLPPAFTPGSETMPSFDITSLYPIYDRANQLHIVACLAPVIRDTNNWLPAEIWHWCEANPDTWDFVHRSVTPDSVYASIGYNAIMACRPSLGQDTWGNLFVAWEEFDGVNYTPGPPDRLRAEIWYSYSSDNGQTWEPGIKITDTDTVTYRFPIMLDVITDTVMVMYMIDEATGFFLYSEGPATSNPIVVQKWQNPLMPGVQGPREAIPRRMDVTVTPNPFSRAARVSYAVPQRGDISLVMYDAAGRPVRTLARGRSEPGRFSAVWDGRTDAGEDVAAGVYLYQYAFGGRRLTGKLTLTR
jgi:hypothetical protein